MTSRWDFPRNVSSIRILAGLGVDYGLSMSQCLENTGVEAGQLGMPDVLVEAGQELQVIRNLMRHLGKDLPLGLEAGGRYHPTTFGIWGFAILSSPTVRDAVGVGLRYLRLSSVFCTPRIEETASEAQFVADGDDLPEDVRDFLIERDAAIVLSLQRDVLPIRLPLTRLEMKRDAPPYAKQIESLFGVTPRFNQVRNRIGMSSALVNLKLPQGDFSALRLYESECQKLLTRRSLRAGLSGKVRNQLMLSIRRMPTMEALASTLGINVRTLRRRLAAEGTDFETLVEEVRRTLAEELLKTTDLSVEEIAERLGYSEPSCFTRAFKRWNELAPRQYRNLQS
jgi:AraC-like DNA-binding protein